MTRALIIAALAAASTGSLAAGEFAVLANGFRIHADRHEVDGQIVRLYSAGAAVIEFPAQQVVSFEQEEQAPVVAVPAPAVAPPVAA
ncbi:MAG: hypothetical protein ABIZ80_17665, partial [Bryobacteraceae bacterium]